MFKKIFRSLCHVVFVALLLTPFVAKAAEDQFVYAGDLSVDKTEYQSGDEIKGNFTLRNAGDRDAGDVSYKVVLAQIDQDNTRKDVKSYAVISEFQSDSLGVAKKTKTQPINFAIKVPEYAKEGIFEIKIEVLAGSGMVLSWIDSKTFSIKGNNKVTTIVNLTSGSIELSDGTRFPLQAGPMIFAEKDPKQASFVGELKNVGTQPVSVDIFTVVSKRPFDSKNAVVSEHVSTTIPSGILSPFTLPLPTFNYESGVYEGKVYFQEDKSGKDLMQPVDFRYLIGGESATIHSLTSDKSLVKKGEEFKIIASITGAPFDISGAVEGQGEVPAQLATFNLTVLNENGTIIVEEVAQDVDLSKTTSFEFNLVASKKSKALKANLTVQNKEGKLLAQFESNLSADYDKQAGVWSRNLLILLLALLAISIATFVFIRFRKKFPEQIKSPTSLASFVAFGLVTASILFSSLTSAVTSPLPAYSYNTDTTKPGFVYTQLMTFYEGNVYEGKGSTASRHFINNSWGPRFVSNMPVDAEYEAGESFTVSAQTTYAVCGNTPFTVDIGAVASGEIAPSDSAFGLDIIPNAQTGMTKEQAKQFFIANFNQTGKSDRTPANALAQFEKNLNQFVDVNGKLKGAYGQFVETLNFGTPIVSLDAPGYKVGYNYVFSKSLTAPTTPGVHKLWFGVDMIPHKDILNAGLCSNNANTLAKKIFCGANLVNFVDFPSEVLGTILGYSPDTYYKVKAYQTYKVLPPKPATFSAANGGACGTVNLAWTQKDAFVTGNVDVYKLYRKLPSETSFTLVKSDISSSALSYVDTLPNNTSGTVTYQLVGRHNASGFDSNPIETTISISGSDCSVVAGACGSKGNGEYVGSSFAFSSSQLCETGTASNSNPSLGEDSFYRWTCGGTNGGATATCSASADAGTPACGTKHGVYTASGYSFNAGELCANGNATPSNPSVSGGVYSWTCSLPNEAAASCSAPATQTPVNGLCGTKNNQEVSAYFSFAGSELCSAGTPPATNPVHNSGNFSWTCEGLNGGADSTCSAPAAPNCGTVTAFPSWPANDSGLCEVGDVTDKNFSSTINRFTWSCEKEGSDLGSVSCSALKEATVPSIPVFSSTWMSCDPVTTPDTNTINLSFKSTSGSAPAVFNVYRSTTQSGTYSLKGSVNASLNASGELVGGFADTTAVPGTTYYFKVEADNDAGLSNLSVAQLASTPATCVEENPVCGEAANQPLSILPTTGTPGLCSSGTANTIALHSSQTKYTWNCNVDGTNQYCEAPRLGAGDAICGSAEGGSYTSAPIGAGNLCNAGQSSTPAIDSANSTKYKWTCTSINGQNVDTCRANVETTPPNNGGGAKYGCGIRSDKTLSAMPNETTFNLCAEDSDIVANSITEEVNTYRWKCSYQDGGQTKEVDCSARTQNVILPPNDCEINGTCADVVDGAVSLAGFKTYPSLVTSGGQCAVNVGAVAGGVFAAKTAQTICRLKYPDGQYGLPFSPVSANDIKSQTVFSQSSFTLECYETDPETGDRVGDVQSKTALCRINPSSIETSFIRSVFDGMRNMTASVFDAVLRFFNLKS